MSYKNVLYFCGLAFRCCSCISTVANLIVLHPYAAESKSDLNLVFNFNLHRKLICNIYEKYYLQNLNYQNLKKKIQICILFCNDRISVSPPQHRTKSGRVGVFRITIVTSSPGLKLQQQRRNNADFLPGECMHRKNEKFKKIIRVVLYCSYFLIFLISIVVKTKQKRRKMQL